MILVTKTEMGGRLKEDFFISQFYHLTLISHNLTTQKIEITNPQSAENIELSAFKYKDLYDNYKSQK